MTRELLGETAGVHRLTRWHCDVAVPGVRAADPETADDWVLGPEYAFGHQRMGGRACGAIATRLDEGRTIAIDYRWADGRATGYRDATGFLSSTSMCCHVRNPTGSCGKTKQPQSFRSCLTAGDPVATGLVASLARPVAMSLVWQLWPAILPAAARTLARARSGASLAWQSSATSVILHCT
jgi:hypothetical protein